MNFLKNVFGKRCGQTKDLLIPRYFEVPNDNTTSLVCSDNACPCSDRKALTPGTDGFVYINPEVVAMREDCLSWDACQRKRQRLIEVRKAEIKAKDGTDLLGVHVSSGIFVPIFMCEQGARMRKLDLRVAAADAAYWAKTGLLPLRATPLVS